MCDNIAKIRFANSLQVKLLSPFAVPPQKAHSQDAGYDLASVETVTLKPGERKLISTGISISIPEGTYGRIAPRSGLAYKSGIDVMGGVIDRGYTGDVGVLLINHSSAQYTVRQGDRIAQLILERIHDAEVICDPYIPSIQPVLPTQPQQVRGQRGRGYSGS